MIRSALLRFVAAVVLLASPTAFASRRAAADPQARAGEFGDLSAPWKAIETAIKGERVEGQLRQDTVNFIGLNARASLTPFEASTLAKALAPNKWDTVQGKTDDGKYAVGDRIDYETPKGWLNRADPKAGKGIIVAVKNNVMQILSVDHNGQPVIFQLSRFQVKKKLARAVDDGQLAVQ